MCPYIYELSLVHNCFLHRPHHKRDVTCLGFFIPGMEKQRQKVGGTNWLINTLIYAILCQNVTIFYRQKLVSLFQIQEKLKACRDLKWNLLSSCFIADDSLLKIVWLQVVVFSEYVLHFRDNVHLLRYNTVKVSQNCFCSFNFSNQIGMQISKFSFPLNK